MKKNLAKLVKKTITDKNGHKRVVWVKVEGKVEVKRKKAQDLVSKYENSLKKINKDLKQDSEYYKQALSLKLIMLHGFRVGNEESAQGFERFHSKEMEKTFGLLTLQRRHVVFKGDKMYFVFKGKRSVPQKIEITNKSLIDGVKYFHSLANEKEPILGMTNYELRKYINSRVGTDYSPKDFRLLRANIEARKKSEEIVKRKEKPKTKTDVNKEINEILDHVSSVLGNTAGVSKRSYIDESILTEHLHKRYKK